MRLSSHRRPVRPVRPASASSPEVCAQLLGEHIRAARLRDGRPLEEVAPLTCLTVPEWEAIEAGQAPDTWEQVLLIAMTLHMGRTWMSYLLPLYAGAGKK